MSDELDQVVRDLEAERHRPSIWWHDPRQDPDYQRRQLALAIGAWHEIDEENK